MLNKWGITFHSFTLLLSYYKVWLNSLCAFWFINTCMLYFVHSCFLCTPIWCWKQDIPEKRGQYHDCWCLGSLHCQVISNHDIDDAGSAGPCLPLGRILTHWGRVTHICVSKPTIIGSDNGLLPSRHQAIFWTNAGILLIRPLGTNFSEILIEIYTFSFKKMHLKMSSGKMAAISSWPQCVNPLHLISDGKWQKMQWYFYVSQNKFSTIRAFLSKLSENFLEEAYILLGKITGKVCYSGKNLGFFAIQIFFTRIINAFYLEQFSQLEENVYFILVLKR